MRAREHTHTHSPIEMTGNPPFSLEEAFLLIEGDSVSSNILILITSIKFD